jgi:xanthine dehydrogenase small subunit
MIRLMVNDREVVSDLPSGTPVVDLLRGQLRMHGTRAGCREGDCGACSVLVGDLDEGRLRYKVMGSCMLPLGNVDGRHVVTIEGLNRTELTPVQQIFADMRAIQCGFCTPGFMVALAAFCLEAREFTHEQATIAVAGNLCRCTGYKSIQRSLDGVIEQLDGIDLDDRIPWLIEHRFLPEYFRDVQARLAALEPAGDGSLGETIISGASDLLVQKPDETREADLRFVHHLPRLNRIYVEDGRCHVGAAVTFNDLRRSDVMLGLYPQLDEFIQLSGSDLVRNMATVGGNIVNGSPIGDQSIFFTTQGSTLVFSRDGQTREAPIREFFVGYKTTAIEPGELLEEVVFDVPDEHTHYSFEKTSKRTHLDMAVVNSGMRARIVDGVIEQVSYAVGGLGSTIRVMTATEDFLVGRRITAETFRAANEVAQGEVTPRSRPEYKRLLVRQQLYLHLARFAPDALGVEVLR